MALSASWCQQEDSLKKEEGTVTEVAVEREIGRLEVDL